MHVWWRSSDLVRLLQNLPGGRHRQTARSAPRLQVRLSCSVADQFIDRLQDTVSTLTVPAPQTKPKKPEVSVSVCSTVSYRNILVIAHKNRGDRIGINGESLSMSSTETMQHTINTPSDQTFLFTHLPRTCLSYGCSLMRSVVSSPLGASTIA